jgi:hypothetical protein
MTVLRHPDVQRNWSQWSEEQTLHVAVAYSNPFRWRTRRELMNRFRDHMEQEANVVLHVGELAYGDRPWEVTSPDNPRDIQLRTTCELFHKENIQNRVILSFPPDWRYGMCCDGDFHILTIGWALETIHQLQHYEWVQPFSSYVDVTGEVYGAANLPIRTNTSFMFNYINNGYRVSPVYHNSIVGKDGQRVVAKCPDPYEEAMGVEGGEFMRGTGATGGACAFRRSAFDAVGGMLDRCILGHGDWYMAHQLVGVPPPDIHTQQYHPNYKAYVTAWGRKATALRKNVGYVDAMAMHHFHGSKTRRGYSSRDVILARNHFDPMEDLITDWQGIYQLRPDAISLRDDIRRYFISRFEDDPNIYSPERITV